MTRTTLAIASLASLCLILAACGGRAPPVRYYQIALPEDGGAGAGQGSAILAIERISADAAYDDARIVYRQSEFRLDYYHYHRWSSPPGLMVTDYLRMAYQQTGRFRSVIGGYSGDADAMLGGRVMAIEEVNRSETDWLARVRLELWLRDASTGELLWSQILTETEPVSTHGPEGLAEALALAMERIVSDTAPAIAEHIP